MAQQVQAVARALSLLDAIASSPEPPTVAELAETAGVNRATTWRLLNTLVHYDLALRDEHSGRFTVGHGALRLAAATDASTMTRRARPLLEQTAEQVCGSVFLEVYAHGGLIVLDECRSASPIQVDLSGVDVPLHCGSAGKLYLASLPDDELETFLACELTAETAYTCTDPAELRRQLEAARRSGVAYNYREHRNEWCGITAAVRDRAGRDLAYLNVTLPTFNTTEVELHALTDIMRGNAAAIAALLA